MVNYGTYFAFNRNPDDWNTTLIPGKLQKVVSLLLKRLFFSILVINIQEPALI